MKRQVLKNKWCLSSSTLILQMAATKKETRRSRFQEARLLSGMLLQRDPALWLVNKMTDLF